jgi:hypothetical protein
MDILRKNNEIVKVLFGLNVIAFIISLFYFKSNVFYITIIMNIILLGTNLIIDKYSVMFEGLLKVNKFAKKLNKQLSGV